MLTENQKKEIEKDIKEFASFLKEHAEFKPQTEEEAIFDRVKSKAVDILLDSETRFFNAISALQKKHNSLTSVEQIDKLTKEILKLCK